MIRRVIVPTVPDGVLSPNRVAKYGFHAKRRARAELRRAARAAKALADMGCTLHDIATLQCCTVETVRRRLGEAA